VHIKCVLLDLDLRKFKGHRESSNDSFLLNILHMLFYEFCALTKKP